MELNHSAVYVFLTCPTEQRSTASNDLKRRKYEPVAAVFRQQTNINVVELVPIDVGARGRPARSLRNLNPYSTGTIRMPSKKRDERP
jgi:hypothetical protein